MKKEEFAEKLYEGISDLDPELMEEALNDHPNDHIGQDSMSKAVENKSTPTSKKRIPWKKWAAAAAGICAIIVGVNAYNTYLKPLTPETKQDDTHVSQENLTVESSESMQTESSEPEKESEATEENSQVQPENLIKLTAGDISEVFEALATNDARGTSNYMVSQFPIEEDPVKLGLLELPEYQDYLEVYEIKTKEVDLDAFTKFVEQYYPIAMKFMELEGPEGLPEIEQRSYSDMCTASYSDSSSGNYRSVLGINRRNCFEMQLTEGGRFQIEGQPIKILPTDSDEQIKEKIRGLLDQLEKAFGKHFPDIRIDRSYNGSKDSLFSVYIHVYDQEKVYKVNDQQTIGYGDEYFTLYFTSYCSFSSVEDWSDGKNVYLTQIIYGQEAYPSSEYVQSKGVLRMLTLEEAEEMLYKGYVFGGHSCPLCMAAQEKVNFEGYDGVSFSYFSGLSEIGHDAMMVPFYQFYKKLPSEDPNVVRYAVTNVCAVEVEDIDEYFIAQEKYHRGSIVTDITELFDEGDE